MTPPKKDFPSIGSLLSTSIRRFSMSKYYSIVSFIVSFTLVLVPVKLNEGARLISDVAGGLAISSDNLLGFHSEISVLPIF